MAFTDLKTFLTVLGQGQDVLGALGTTFGVPNCIMELGRDVLQLLPTTALFGIAEELENGRAMADSVTKSIMSQIRNVLGIVEWDSEEGGLRFVSNSSKMGSDSAAGGTIGALAGLVAGTAALGSNLYANYQMAREQVEQIIDCINSYVKYLRFKKGNSAEELAKLDPVAFRDFVDKEYQMQMIAVRQAIDAFNAMTDQLGVVTGIITARADGSEEEPIFNCDAYEFVSGTGLAVNCPQPAPPPVEIFRLIYGPPRSSAGQFVLSKDGIYFDSQASGLIPALTYLVSKKETLAEFRSKRWTQNYDPNLGGRGDSFSTEDLKSYVKTILDPDIIDDSAAMQEYYDKDGFLQELIGNRNKRIYDLSSQISELEVDSAPEAIIYNQRQSLISENALFLQKINKRKKQIELAVALPLAYNQTRVYLPGQIPINDFSYLEGINLEVDLQKQKALSFSQVDIDGVVSPLQLSSTYVVSKINTSRSSVEHLMISDLGNGAIIYDGSSVSSTNSVILQAENVITTDSLIAMYNFLDTSVEQPSSTSFSSRNSASESDEYYAQLVGDGQTSLFRPGLGIPYFQGITRQSSVTPAQASGLGTFMKLPSKKKFNDFLYNRGGASIDFWAYTPGLLSVTGYDSGSVSSLYRLVLSNENTGYNGTNPRFSSEANSNILGGDTIRGFMLGFTRDRRLTNEAAASNDTDDNLAASAVFFIAPTQSTSVSSVGLINRSGFDGDSCDSDTRYHGMVHPVSGSEFSSCQSEFCHVAVTFNPNDDTIKFYLDGSLVTTSSMSYVFGTDPYQMPNLPTFKKLNSFEYNSSSVGINGPASLKSGPRLDKYFTPWIIGGGYTDGMFNYGNFMGGTYGGIISGLRGNLGSLKFYSKPLSETEILNNYKTHEGFFKNIDIASLNQ